MLHRMETLMALLAFVGGVDSAAALTLGVVGDSLSDEYAEETYGSYAANWVEQLDQFAGVDTGPTAAASGQPGGTWSEPRRTQNQYNWARSGADSDTMLSAGQHTGLAGLVAPEGIEAVVVVIGANDFYPTGSAYLGIYNGTWSQAEIDAYNLSRMANINTALDTLIATGVPVVVGTVPDYGLAPLVRFFFSNVAGRQAVADAIAALNAEIQASAQAREIVVFDLAQAAGAIFGTHASPESQIVIGGVPIFLGQSDTAAGGNPDGAFVNDGVHPNATLQGLFANLVIQALNTGYETDLVLFSEAEILDRRSLAYVGPDTLEAEIGSYSDFVNDYTPAAVAVPSLSPASLALVVVAFLAGGVRFLSRRS